MADQQSIQEVLDCLPPDAAADGWDETKVAGYLDGGKSVKRTLQAYWMAKAAKTSNLVSISESGSSRDLSKIYDNAMSQQKFWKDAADEEESKAEEAIKGRIRFHGITRV